MISDDFQTALNLDLVEDYENTQSYVTTLFDTLPKIQLSSLSDKGTNLIKKLITQNQEYAKKIIELSEKFTFFYRKDHIFDKKDVQQKIKLIYQIVIDQQIPSSMQVDEMLSLILKKLKSDSYNMIKAGYQHLQESHGRNSQIENIMANRMIESKIQPKNMLQSSIKQSKFAVANENLYLQGLNPNGQNLAQSVAVSRKQSIQSKNKSAARSTTKKRQKNILEDDQVPLKKLLKIKALMQEEQTAIKQMFSKIANLLDELKVSKLNLSEQKLTYTKVEDETNQQNLEQLLQASTANHKSNLHKVSQLMEIIFCDFQKKIAQEMQSENQFTLYTKEIQKRQEVYSYAVSKLIGHLNNLKNNFSQQNHRESMGIVEDLIAIGTKFYELYPSNSIIKDLKVRAQKRDFEQQNHCNYAVQVNTIKSSNSVSASMKNSSSTYSQSNRQSAQYQLQMFKFETKVTELFDKFQKTQLKFKKAVEVKEVHKLLNSIKQLVPQRSKTTLSSLQLQELTKFQSEYRQLVTQSQEKEQKLAEQSHKRQRKLQKQIKQLQKKLQLQEQQKSKQTHYSKEQLKKLTKKLQSTQQKYKQAQKKNQESQKIVKLIQEEIQLIKKNYREQQLQFQHKFQIQQQKLALISQQTSKKESKLEQISSKQEQKQSEFEAELMLYKKKIVLLEDKNVSMSKENEHLQNRLESVTVSAELSKQNLSQMTEVYQKKIKQVDQMIQNIEEMRHELDKKNGKISDLEQQNQKLHSISSHFEAQIEKQLQIINRLKEELENKRKEKEKIEITGQLNESDIQKLKKEMAKVHEAYMESEQELENLRQLYEQLENQANRMQEENSNLSLQNSQLSSKLQQTRLALVKYKNLEKNNQYLVQTNNTLQSENNELSGKFKDLQVNNWLKQNELYLIKKQSKKIKEEELEHSKELRELRQQLQRLKEEQTLIKGKNKIELESLKIELRKKTEENSKIKQIYEQKLDILSTKYKELQKFVTQKQLLAKISHNHSTQ